MTAIERAEAAWQAARAWAAAAPKGHRQRAQARLDEATKALLKAELRKLVKKTLDRPSVTL